MPVGTWVLIREDDGNDHWHDGNANLYKYCGVVVHCEKVGDVVFVYALLEDFRNYGPLLLAKGTTRTMIEWPPKIASMTEEERILYHEWVWPKENDIPWELPPRNDKERNEHSMRHDTCDVKDCQLCGKTRLDGWWWEHWEVRRKALIERAKDAAYSSR